MAIARKAGEFWAEFCSSTDAVELDEPYQVWYFGHTPELAEELAALVLQGKKTATASLAETNLRKPDEAPIHNGYSVVTDYYGEPMCVVQTTEMRHMAFRDVDPVFAAQEGEGDRSLEYWQRVHRECFTLEAERLGFSFDENSVVCCERFRLLYPR
ncbi:MAG TPA: ASCH domain-containing protein [Pyrinomonadaceae bacterium]|nr:ASCH domain-containing protein [Pyrinomonadaceae bacterium]